MRRNGIGRFELQKEEKVANIYNKNHSRAFRDILSIQRERGASSTRHVDKRAENRNQGYIERSVKGSGALLDRIHGRRSFQIHTENAKRFSDYLKKEHPGVERARDIKRAHAESFLKHLQNRGLRARTIEGYQTTINHLFHDSKSKEWQKPLYMRDIGLRSRADDDISRNRSNQGHYERKDVSRYTEKAREPMRLAQAFGLRRSEVVVTYDKRANQTEREQYQMYEGRSFSNHPARENSIIEHDSKLYMQTIGKGGQYRIIECLPSHENEIRAHFNDYIRTVEDLPTKEAYLESERTSALLFEPVQSSQSVSHINFQEDARQYYANMYLEEHRGSYNASDDVVVINDTEVSRELAERLSEQLGHHRLDVLSKYINV